jgi:hypothetical protein
MFNNDTFMWYFGIIDELIEWAVDREMYEDCAMMVRLKERVIETFDVQSLIK